MTPYIHLQWIRGKATPDIRRIHPCLFHIEPIRVSIAVDHIGVDSDYRSGRAADVYTFSRRSPNWRSIPIVDAHVYAAITERTALDLVERRFIMT
jgi:hypothetical protein